MALGLGGTIVVAVTATLAAIGAAAIPSAGLVTMLMVLQARSLLVPYRQEPWVPLCPIASSGLPAVAGQSVMPMMQVSPNSECTHVHRLQVSTDKSASTSPGLLPGQTLDALLRRFKCAQAVDLDRFAGDLAIILALDWLLDRCRTVTNILGDAFGVVLIDHLLKHHAAPAGSTQQPYASLEMT